jgi:hypothetical protein
MCRLSPTITYSTWPLRSMSAPIWRRVSCDSSRVAAQTPASNLVRRYPPGVKLFYPAKLIRLEACSVSDYVLDNSFPPSTLTSKPKQKRTFLTFPLVRECFGLKLQDE